MTEQDGKHPALKILEDLVSIQSVNPHYGNGACGEGEVADYIERRFQGTNVRVTRQPVFPGRDNLLIELRTGHPESTLLFETHMDTVSIGSMADAVTPIYRGDRLYARGACDAKGSLAGMIWAIEECAKHPERLMSDIVLCAAVDEEHEYRGLRVFMDRNMPVAGAVVGEPTELGIVVAHKGCARFAVETLGKAAHSSMPEEGDSAVYQMVHVLQFIKHVMEPELAKQRHPLCGSPTIVAGTIAGGTQVNIVPEHCSIELDRRIIPGELPEDAIADFERRLQEYIDSEGLHVNISFRELLLDWALETPQDSEIVAHAQKVAQALELRTDLLGVTYGSDASKLQRKGIPTIVYGPGSIAQAHSKEEWVSVHEVERAAQFYYQLALSFHLPR
ncbi:M20 family metallopeptidase [Paenibacillus spongiae]|uniref:M20/M25/M40 family metallo-hydrolase n=1 Tax=Paenibacillus spongiae TaxID=2909671 RepID=A0ABY5SBM7_9BACL|nr:M20/M25/M40 family metallo-hydrolase [Paenibacillus spongiae]UVI31346.1 M20/M25/M40 family metallo-hydrolase [Paenibacillus spongiae]